MKTLKLFGKTIPVWILALTLTAGIGSAALVGYISNTVSMKMEVKTPIVLKISDGIVAYNDTVDFGAYYGSDSIIVYVQSNNQASNPVQGKIRLTVDNDIGITCPTASDLGDFSDIKYDDVTIASTITCANINSNEITLTSGSVTWPTGISTDTITLVMKADALGNYSISGQAIV